MASLEFGLQPAPPRASPDTLVVPRHPAFDGSLQPAATERLREAVDRAGSQVQDGGVELENAGRHDDGRLRKALAQLLGQPESIVSRHPDVAERDSCRAVAHPLERLIRTGGLGRAVSVRPSPPGHQRSHSVFIVDNQYGTHNLFPPLSDGHDGPNSTLPTRCGPRDSGAGSQARGRGVLGAARTNSPSKGRAMRWSRSGCRLRPVFPAVCAPRPGARQRYRVRALRLCGRRTRQGPVGERGGELVRGDEETLRNQTPRLAAVASCT